MLNWPLTLWEPVVFLMLLIAIEMEDALHEVLGEHYWIPLQQEMHQAELCKPRKERELTRQLLKVTPETQQRVTSSTGGVLHSQVSLNTPFSSCPVILGFEQQYQLIDLRLFFIQENDTFQHPQYYSLIAIETAINLNLNAGTAFSLPLRVKPLKHSTLQKVNHQKPGRSWKSISGLKKVFLCRYSLWMQM